jgi:hypothetical protein
MEEKILGTLFVVCGIKVRYDREAARGAHPFNAKCVTVAIMIKCEHMKMRITMAYRYRYSGAGIKPSGGYSD